MRAQHAQERQALIWDLSQVGGMEPEKEQPNYPADTLRGKFQEAAKAPGAKPGINPGLFKGGPDADADIEPEI